MLVVVLTVPFSKIIIQSIIGHHDTGGHLRRRLHLRAHLPPRKLPDLLLRAGRVRSAERLQMEAARS